MAVAGHLCMYYMCVNQGRPYLVPRHSAMADILQQGTGDVIRMISSRYPGQYSGFLPFLAHGDITHSLALPYCDTGSGYGTLHA